MPGHGAAARRSAPIVAVTRGAVSVRTLRAGEFILLLDDDLIAP